MTTIVTRAGKGSPLTWNEVDTNFTNLNSAKYESGNNVTLGTIGGTAITSTSFSTSGNLSFTGTGNRITGDFSNATIANRVSFQSSTTNGATAVNALPNGTSRVSTYQAYDNTDPTNSSYIGIVANGTNGITVLESSIRGTGTYLPMTFYTGGSERVRIDTSGNVGIGTSSPVVKLKVVGDTTIVGDGTDAFLNLKTDYTSGYLGWVDATNSMSFWNTLSGFINFGTSNTERMRIDSSGNVGIGGTPSSAANNTFLTVNNSSGAGGGIVQAKSTNVDVRLQADTAAGYVGTFSNHPTLFFTNSTEKMRISADGNVGVGTVPSYKFHVAGDVSAGAVWGAFQNASATANSTGGILTVASGANNYTALYNVVGGLSYLQAAGAAGLSITTVQATPMIFNTNSLERMRIHASGGVSIGSTVDPGIGELLVSGQTSIGTSSAPTSILTLGAGTATANTAPIKLTAGTNLTAAEAGAVEYDGTMPYFTSTTTSGRGYLPAVQVFGLSANGTAFGPAIGNFFGANSAINLAAAGEYEVEAYCYFTKTTAGTVTVTATTSLAPAILNGTVDYGAATGGTATGASNRISLFASTATASAFGASASLTTAVNHCFVIKLILESNASASNIRINFTCSAGTVTPLRQSYYKVTRLPSANVGSFAA